MFTTCKLDFVNPGKMFGVIMDFSQAQINGFLAAYTMYTGRNDGLSYLKGCYMHWMQSVQRISSNHNMVPPEHHKRFLRYAYIQVAHNHVQPGIQPPVADDDHRAPSNMEVDKMVASTLHPKHDFQC